MWGRRCHHRTSTGQWPPSGQPEEHSVSAPTHSGGLEGLSHGLVRSFLASEDPLTSEQLALLSRSLAELSLSWAFQNVLPVSLPVAHPSVTQAFEVGSEVS